MTLQYRIVGACSVKMEDYKKHVISLWLLIHLSSLDMIKEEEESCMERNAAAVGGI